MCSKCVIFLQYTTILTRLMKSIERIYFQFFDRIYKVSIKKTTIAHGVL